MSLGNIMMIYGCYSSKSLMDEVLLPSASALFLRNLMNLFIYLEQIKSTLLSRCERFHTSFRRKCLLLCLLGIYMWVPVFKKRIRKNITWIAQYKWTKVCGQVYLVWGYFSRALLGLHFKERHQCYHFILILLLETQVLLGSLCKCCVPLVKWWVTGPSIIPCPFPQRLPYRFFCFL